MNKEGIDLSRDQLKNYLPIWKTWFVSNRVHLSAAKLDLENKLDLFSDIKNNNLQSNIKKIKIQIEKLKRFAQEIEIEIPRRNTQIALVNNRVNNLIEEYLAIEGDDNLSDDDKENKMNQKARLIKKARSAGSILQNFMRRLLNNKNNVVKMLEIKNQELNILKSGREDSETEELTQEIQGVRADIIKVDELCDEFAALNRLAKDDLLDSGPTRPKFQHIATYLRAPNTETPPPYLALLEKIYYLIRKIDKYIDKSSEGTSKLG